MQQFGDLILDLKACRDILSPALYSLSLESLDGVQGCRMDSERDGAWWR
jgi:hypothetical protein